MPVCMVGCDSRDYTGGIDIGGGYFVMVFMAVVMIHILQGYISRQRR